MICNRFKPSLWLFSKSDLEREKMATSAPEINAEQIKRTKIKTIPTTTDISIADIIDNKLEGSGSNFMLVG